MRSSESGGGWLPSPSVLIALWAFLQLVLSPTAFRIDEPTFLAIAKQIAIHPLDPYGFLLNWDYEPELAFRILANPPLVPAWLALFGRLFGWSEWIMHLAMLPFGLVVLTSIASLARDFNVDSRRAVALALASPIFLVGSMVVMPDVAMLALSTLSIAGVTRWQKTNRPVWLWFAAAGALLAPLAKYNGVVVIVPLVVLAFAHRRRSLWPALIATLPFVSLQLWNAATMVVYGESHFGAAASFQGTWRFAVNGVLVGLGAAVLPLGATLGQRWRSGQTAVLAVAFAGILAFGVLVDEYRAAAATVFAAAITLSLAFLIRLIHAWVTRDPWSEYGRIALLGWLCATLVLQFRLLFNAPRYLLPLLPAAVLLALIYGRERAKLWENAILILSLVLSLAVTVTDALQSNAYRTEVREAAHARGRLFAAGHWGFQYYAEEAGAPQLNAYEPPVLLPGDRVLIARAPFPRVRGVEGDVSRTTLSLQSGPLVTLSCSEAVNLHGNGIGSCANGLRTAVPFVVSREPFDRIDVFDVGPGGARVRTSE